MTRLTRRTDRFALSLVAEPMGRDLCVCLHGGDAPHIGAVAVAVPYPGEPDPEHPRVSVSLITVPGHREDELSKRMAAELAKARGCVVSVSCGIHLDRASREEIDQVLEEAESLLRELIGLCGTGPCAVPDERP